MQIQIFKLTLEINTNVLRLARRYAKDNYKCIKKVLCVLNIFFRVSKWDPKIIRYKFLNFLFDIVIAG